MLRKNILIFIKRNTLISALKYKNSVIFSQENSIKTLSFAAKRTWWERNEKYFAFGLGALAGFGFNQIVR